MASASTTTVDRTRSSGARRMRILTGVAIVAGLMLLIVALAAEKAWSGRFPLTIRIESRPGATVMSVAYYATARVEEADALARNPRSYEAEFKVAEKEGEAFVASIPCGGRRIDWLGWERTYSEAEFVALRIRFDSGVEETQVVRVPSGRGPREVSVALE